MASPASRAAGVLLVDDDDALLDALAEALGPLDCEVSRARTAAEALLSAAGRSFDVMVLDLMLPDFTGLVLAERLRTEGSLGGAQLVFITGTDPGEEVLSRALALGCADFVTKPVRMGLFRARIRVLLELAHANERLRAREEELAETERSLFDALCRLNASSARKHPESSARNPTAAQALQAADVALETLRQSEERYRLAARASNDVLWDWDVGAPTITFSATLAKTLGHMVETKDGLCEVPITWRREQLHPEDASRIEQSIRACVESQAESWAQEYRFRLGNGAYAHVIDRAYVVRDSAGRALRMVGALQDITALKEQASQLKERADFQQQLVGIVSHDLRNPIGAIQLGASMMLMRGDLPKAQETSAQQIVRAAERATRMVRDLLDFTRLRLGGGIPIQPKPSDLKLLAEQSVREVQTAHPGREVELSVDGETTGTWDGDRISQLLSNLLGNAVAYSPQGSKISVRVEGSSADVQLSVHNAGDPIPEKLLPHLFEPLRRGDPADQNPSARSIGLGLYIVQNIARAHGGLVEVKSAQDEGTTFSVRLPRYPPASVARGSGVFSLRALKAAQEAARKSSS